MSAPKKYIFNFVTEAYLSLIFFCNCHPQPFNFLSKLCTQLLIRYNFQKYPQELDGIYDFQRTLKVISKPLNIFSQTFGTKVLRSFFKTHPSKQQFSKFFKDATFGNESFRRFSEGRNFCVERWFVNDGLPTSTIHIL